MTLPKSWLKVSLFTAIIAIALAAAGYSWRFKTEPKRENLTALPALSPEQKRQLALVDKIIFQIKNPPKEVMEEEKINPKAITADNMVLIYGSDPKVLREMTGKEYDPDRSLLGVKAYIERGDNEKALGVLEWVWTIAGNGQFNDPETGLFNGTGARSKKGKTVAELDPKRVFYPPTAPANARDYFPVHREQAMYDMIALMVELKY